MSPQLPVAEIYAPLKAWLAGNATALIIAPPGDSVKTSAGLKSVGDIHAEALENVLLGETLAESAGYLPQLVFLAVAGAAIILLMARFVFHVPMIGSLLLLAGALAVYVIANLAVGYTFSTIAENQLQAMSLKNQQLNDVVKDLRHTQTKRFDLINRMQSARAVLARLDIRSPVSGKIVNLAVHAGGEVVKPGDTVVQIVPLKDAIEVEARVRPEDADNVHVGMPARVSFGAYSARRMPMILGTVNNVSADRQVDERTGQAYFTVNVTVDRGKLTDYRDVKLMPGLPVDVALGTGSRTARPRHTERQRPRS